MLFTSLAFLYVFLPLTLIVYYLAPRGLKNAVLLVFSLLFYFYGEPVYTLLILCSALVGYLSGICLEVAKTPGRKKTVLILTLVLSLGALGVFKYADLAVSSVNAVFGAKLRLLRLALPIGISFYTFQILSYVVDVYRQTVRAERNPITFFAYVTLFPQLIAGPIVRYTDISAALSARKETVPEFALGLRRFILGLGKKVLLANVLGELVSAANAASEATVLSAWLAAAGYMLQIYFDFSAYSDMAIGLGHLFGFTFPENFNYPYIADSVTAFWRRWHMTLSRFFRDYVYIPLGGSRVPKGRMRFNLLVVWGLTGLWHGASWTFVLWGLYYFALLLIEKLLPERWKPRGALGIVLTLLITLEGFVLFSSDTLGIAVSRTAALFGIGGLSGASIESLYLIQSYGFLLIVSLIGATPLMRSLAQRLPERIRNIFEVPVLLLLLILATASLVDGSFNPFLYFRF